MHVRNHLVCLAAALTTATAASPASGLPLDPGHFRRQQLSTIAAPVRTDLVERASVSAASTLLTKKITVYLRDAPMEQALTAVAAAAGVPVAFSPDAIVPGTRVSVAADNRALGDVMRSLLADRGLDLWISKSGQLVVIPVVRRAELAVAPVAQATGTVAGTITGTGSRPLAGASVAVAGTARGTQTDAQGRYTITGVPVGARTVRATFAGYKEGTSSVTVGSGQTVTANLALTAQVVQLEAIVAIGYGTQRREAVTGSVSTVNVEDAKVGQITAPTQLLQGRVAGVQIVQNDGTPGAGVNVRIRGGTSISASNDPLYVIDNVPINNTPTEPTNIGANNSLARNPLSMLDPSDIESITVLKDASATAIYGSRGANGVVLIQTKRGREGRVQMSYEGYTSFSQPSKSLDLLNGDEYRAFVQQEVAAGRLAASRLTSLGTDNTDWEGELLRNTVSQNHSLSFSGGAANTQYHGSLGYTNQQGIVRSSGLQRFSGRVNASQQAWDDRLQVGLNLSASQVNNDYVPSENTGGFTGTVFTNMVIFNPTRPVTVTDPQTGIARYFEMGTGSQAIRNPVAIAEQVRDDGTSTRILGNLSTELKLLPQLTAQVNVGTDRAEGVRRAYYPKVNPIGAEFNGQALVSNLSNTTETLQTYLTYSPSLGSSQMEVLGGYEFNNYSTIANATEARSFITDAFGYNNLGAGAILQPPSSSRIDSRLVSFFGRANYNLAGRYFLTGVLRYDGSSRFGTGNKWAVFPAVSGAWLISNEEFMANSFLSELRLKAGYGLQGSQEINPYSSLITLNADARAVIGEQVGIGVAPAQNPNPNLKWEQTSQWNVGLDYGILDNRFRGTLDFYQKETSDLLLTVPVAQPAMVTTRLENVGSMQNRGAELSLDATVFSNAGSDLVLGLVGSVNRNKVVSLGSATFINTGSVSGQGQGGQFAQRIIPGYAIGTFFGPEYAGVDANGKQLFNKYDVTRDAAGRTTSRTLVGQTTTPTANDYGVIGDANPNYSLSGRGQGHLGRFDLSFLVRGEFGQDVFNNTALVYSTKGNALQDKNFLKSALSDPIGIREPAIFSSRWIEDGSYIRFQNVSLGYSIPENHIFPRAGTARLYLSGDNLLLLTKYTGYDPDVFTSAGLASRGIDYLKYPNPRTFTTGVHLSF